MNTQTQLKEIISSGLTQEVISSRAHVSQPTISRILSGKHTDMKASTASSIARLHSDLFAIPVCLITPASLVFQLQCGFYSVFALGVRAFFYSLIHGAIIQCSMGSNIDHSIDYEVWL